MCIPFAAFLALAYVALVNDGEDYCSAKYLRRANELCTQGVSSTTLPLIAVCCFHGALLERILHRLRYSGCPLDDRSPSSSVPHLTANLTPQHKTTHMISIHFGHQFEATHGNKALRCQQATPLSFLVSRNDLDGVTLLLKLGVQVDSVCIHVLPFTEYKLIYIIIGILI